MTKEKLVCYDVEIFSNCFMVDFYFPERNEHKTFTFFEGKYSTDDIQEFKNFTKKLINEDITLISFNGIHFDQPVIWGFLGNEVRGAYEICQDIINNKHYFEKGIDCKEIDVFKILPKKCGGLKKIQARLGLSIEEYKGDFAKPLAENMIEHCEIYVRSDTESTYKVYKHQLAQNGIKIREWFETSKKYNQYIFNLNRTESQLGCDILIEKLKDFYGVRSRNQLKEYLKPRLEFKGMECFTEGIKEYEYYNTFFNEALRKFYNHQFEYEKVYQPDKGISEFKPKNPFEYQIPLNNGGVIKLGEGGLHLHDIYGVFKGNLVNVDVGSQYPNIVNNYQIAPSFLGGGDVIFSKMYRQILEERMAAKKQADKLKDKALKIPLNAVTGDFKNPFSPLADPYCHTAIIANAQFSLLKLIDELLYNNFKILHANTDGIVVENYNDELLCDIMARWEVKFNLSLDRDELNTAIILDTNNYAFYNDHEKIKSVGRTMVTEMDIDKGGVEPAIVGIALREYAQNGLDPSFVITEEIKKNNLEAFIFVRQVKTPLECKGVYRYILTEIGDEPVTPTVTNYKSKITYLQDNLSKYKLSEFFINTKPYINLIQSKIDVLTGVKDEREAEKREKRKIQENARWAEWYRNQGWSIIPIETNGKKPIVNWKTYQEKPATKKLTKEWFRKSEENLGCVRPNIGVVCGKVSGITVMDIDTQEIEDDFINTYGDKYPIVKTGKGYHIYFPYNGEESRRINNYIEIKSNGCYILLPPSIHPNGKEYEWYLSHEMIQNISDTEPWDGSTPSFSEKTDDDKKTIKDGLYKSKPQEVKEGNRNNTLASKAGEVLKTQNNLETAWEMVKDYNDNMPQPLPERELKTTFKSIVKKEERTKADLKNLNLDFNYDDIGWTRKFLEYLSQENRNRFCFDADTWYYYDGDVWKIDYKESNVRRKWNTFVEKMRENAEKVTNDKTKNYYLKQIDKATAINKENAVMRKITSLIAQKIEARDFDNDDLILNVWNGTIELGNDIHREHKPEDLLTKTARTNFDQEARAPNWLKFIDDITGGNGELSEYLQTAIGYSATGDRTYHSCFFLYGTGANGKSTFLEVIHEILGDYVRTTDVNCLLSSNSESNNIQYALHNLKGVRMAIAPETAETKKLSEDVIKKLSGGDTVMARAPYGRPIEFQPRFKLWIHGNYKPLIYGDDKGIWRRFKLIPFNQCFDNDSIVLDIKEKLLQEREGILNWILEGVKKWIQNGKKLIEPKCVKSEIEAYKKESDIIGQFLEESFEEGEWQEREYIKVKEVKARFVEWCNEADIKPLTSHSFNRRMKNKEFKYKVKKIDRRMVKVWEI